MNVADVRFLLQEKFSREEYAVSQGNRTVEIVAASFDADEETIFGPVNRAYVQREIEWYRSQSLNIDTFPGEAPSIWKTCAGKDGSINSNYGWCLFSKENGCQYLNVFQELKRDPGSRRAEAIYNRPSMHTDATLNGRQDFMCTNAVQYLIRDGRLHCVVQMRSSDAVLGYRNDLAWHRTVLEALMFDLKVELGTVHWQAGSLHVYERHFHYLGSRDRILDRGMT